MITFLRVFSGVLLVLGAIGAWQVGREIDALGLELPLGSSLGFSYFVWLLVVILPLLAFASVLERLDSLTEAVANLAQATRVAIPPPSVSGRGAEEPGDVARVSKCPKCGEALKNVSPGQVCYYCGGRL